MKWNAYKIDKLRQINKSVILKLIKQVFKGPLCVVFILNRFYLELQAFIHLFIDKHIKTVMTFTRYQSFFLWQVLYDGTAIVLDFKQFFDKILSPFLELIALSTKIFEVSLLNVLIVVSRKSSFIGAKLVLEVFFHFEENWLVLVNKCE